MIKKENLEEMLKVIGYVRDAHKKIYEKRYVVSALQLINDY